MCRAGLIAGIDKSPHLPYQRAGGIAPSPGGAVTLAPRAPPSRRPDPPCGAPERAPLDRHVLLA